MLKASASQLPIGAEGVAEPPLRKATDSTPASVADRVGFGVIGPLTDIML